MPTIEGNRKRALCVSRLSVSQMFISGLSLETMSDDELCNEVEDRGKENKLRAKRRDPEA
jgi:hypothetical protein